ncbi:MAG: SWIM zinc finger family protein [Bryobacterales bacterium]|nr:SWIM zinc finger family protein [Bryobacterales bacterium]
MPNNLAWTTNDAVIRRLAGGRSYQRGLDYFSQGQVESLEDGGDCVRAIVRGNQKYHVILAADDEVPEYSCDCPVGSDGAFCKHCVAVALAWMNRAAEPSKAVGRRKTEELTLVDAGKILQAKDKDTLLRLVLDWAKDDDRLRERLILYAARSAGPDRAADTVRRAFDNAVSVDGFIPYREATAWARGVDDAIDSIDQLLKDGQAGAVIELCELALQSLLEAVEAIDDSDGHFSMLRDRLQDIHYRACQKARPDPPELARRLFQWEMQSDFDVFFGAAEQYADILGAKGMKVYGELAETEWAKVPARTVKSQRSEWGQHFRITHIMESLAKASGDVEQLVTVMSHDLSSAHSYLRIAEAYRDARQHENALHWAEKGLKAFPDRTDARLREFVAEQYHRRGRHEEAMKLMWAEFIQQPLLAAYKTLERHANKAGAWPEWRERALAEIRSRIAKAKQKARQPAHSRWMQDEGDYSPLVEIFLFEGDPESAWREAQTGGCSDRLWLRLAAAREKANPEDAAPIYMKLAEAAVAATSNGRYEDSVGLLVKAATAMRRIDRSAEFVHQLDALRVKYKIKRNFIKQLEQKRKSLYG